MALPRLNGERQRQRVVARHCQEPYGAPLSEALWQDIRAMPPGSGTPDVAPALVLAQEGGVLVEQWQNRLAPL
jgi:hypothetical protein